MENILIGFFSYFCGSIPFGLIITKIDGSAKGGALISIAKKYEIPIHFVGLGEKAEDLYEFNAKFFAKSMIGIEK